MLGQYAPFSMAALNASAASRMSTKLTPPQGVNGSFLCRNDKTVEVDRRRMSPGPNIIDGRITIKSKWCSLAYDSARISASVYKVKIQFNALEKNQFKLQLLRTYFRFIIRPSFDNINTIWTFSYIICGDDPRRRVRLTSDHTRSGCVDHPQSKAFNIEVSSIICILKGLT